MLLALVFLALQTIPNAPLTTAEEKGKLGAQCECKYAAMHVFTLKSTTIFSLI